MRDDHLVVSDDDAVNISVICKTWWASYLAAKKAFLVVRIGGKGV